MSCAICRFTVKNFDRLGKSELFDLLRNPNVILTEKIWPKYWAVCKLTSENEMSFFYICRTYVSQQPENKFKLKVKCNFKQTTCANTFFAGSTLTIDDMCSFVVFAYEAKQNSWKRIWNGVCCTSTGAFPIVVLLSKARWS